MYFDKRLIGSTDHNVAEQDRWIGSTNHNVSGQDRRIGLHDHNVSRQDMTSRQYRWKISTIIMYLDKKTGHKRQ